LAQRRGNGVKLSRGPQSREVRVDDGTAELDGRQVAFERVCAGGGEERIVVDGRAHRVLAAPDGERILVWCDGVVHTFTRARPGRPASSDAGADLLAPMPGRVRRIHATVGQAVKRGEVLLVLEAMKMEHAIRAPHDGRVGRVLVGEGELVDAGAELVALA
jgi:biotin carboxyl carrier protein